MLRGSLPPSLQVPPVPQPIHKHLFIRSSSKGLVVSPHPRTSSSNSPGGSSGSRGAILIGWGQEGKVVKIEEASGDVESQADRGDDVDQDLEVRGLLGIVRLWSAAYLLVIVRPRDIGSPPWSQSTIYNLPANSIQAIALERTLASASLARIAGLSSHTESSSSEDGSADEDEGDAQDNWHQSGEVETPAVELLQEALDPDVPTSSHSEDKSFFPWNPFAPASNAHKEKAAPSAEDSEHEVNGEPTPSKRVSLKWNPFATKSKAPKPTLPAAAAAEPAPSQNLALSAPVTPPLPLIPPSKPTSGSSTPSGVSEIRLQLERRIVGSLCALFASGQFFFAYDIDITRTPFGAAQANVGAGIPLWRRVKKEFWWNEWLSSDLQEIGAHSFVLPVMQGYIQTRVVHLPAGPPEKGSAQAREGEEIKIAVISRRSRDRAGLRYQRRGIDDEGHVANFVESEQVVQTKSATFSYLQIRGSIPLYWAQSPYAGSQLSLKPAPTLERPLKEAFGPMSDHFDHLLKTYGPQTTVSLSEVTGKEGVVSNGYREALAELAKDGVCWREFDFHHECKGMKFENVSKLVDQMDKIFAAQGYGEIRDGAIVRTQKGTFRTNCIDCLDRTNVVQSAFARHVLTQQLTSVGVKLPSSAAERAELEAVFNDIWANNGDAISRSYAGTSALKGDFTRTGKRDWQGMLNDGLNSVARMYSSAFSDFFSQAVIDFALGHRGKSMFTSEFMSKMSTAEPASILRLGIIRREAIETCSSRVLEEGETRLAGWTLFSPREMNTTGGAEFEEKILLLTKKAIYVCSFDYNLEKVIGFTRINLGNIDSIQRGAYILSPLQEAGQDAEENSGFKLFFRSAEDDTRVTSYTLRNERPSSTPSQTPTSSPVKAKFSRSSMPTSMSSSSLSSQTGLRPLVLSPSKPLEVAAEDKINYFAFKGISRDLLMRRRNPSGDRAGRLNDDNDEDDSRTCRELVNSIVMRIKLQCSEAGSGWDVGDKRFIVDEDVRSLSEAERETSWSSRIEYGIKRFLWL